MKILGINGSQRKEGNSYLLLKSALEGARAEDERWIETEILQLRDFEIKPCEAHYSGLYEFKNWGCGKKPYRCILKDDFEKVFQKMIEADGIIIASPLYYPVPAKLVALMERLMAIVYFAKKADKNYVWPLTGKPFGAVATSYEDTTILVLKILKKFGFIARMYLVREAKNKVFSVDAKGGVEKNPESLEEAKRLGSIVARTLIKREERTKKKGDERHDKTR
ncbi:flavodoxin family protein [Candidatus Kuenenbacteria bacterium]|nr:flavodoxin family protein [Candidatus Kuenenbacteria bacterium]